MTAGMISPPPQLASPPLPEHLRLSDIDPYDGAATAAYSSAVESLTRHNAAVIELGAEDAARMYFRMTAAQWQGQSWKGSGMAGARGVYVYRAGSAEEDVGSTPPGMEEIFKCMGKAARVALCAIARHLRLRSDAFVTLLDDIPLPANKVSSSMVVASLLPMSFPNGTAVIAGVKHSVNGKVERGILTLISSDGLRAPNGSSSPGDLLLVTGKALSHVTAGLCPAALYRVAPDCLSSSTSNGRTSLAFRLIPRC